MIVSRKEKWEQADILGCGGNISVILALHEPLKKWVGGNRVIKARSRSGRVPTKIRKLRGDIL